MAEEEDHALTNQRIRFEYEQYGDLDKPEDWAESVLARADLIPISPEFQGAEAQQYRMGHCLSEPIHIPGRIQEHGYLICTDTETGLITHVSENVAELGYDLDDLLTKRLSDILDATEVEELGKFTPPYNLKPMRSFQVTLGIGECRRKYDAVSSCRGSKLILELEETLEYTNKTDIYSFCTRLARELPKTASVREAAQLVVEAMSEFVEFDRVMAYQFHPDYHGEVVAEKVRPGVSSYLGLHFPATDIPPQARALFIRNVYTSIVNVDCMPVGIYPPTDPKTGKPIDMTLSTLRSMSPGHLQYLRNMKVGATFCITVCLGNKLWGLVVCHHCSPKRITFAQRMDCVMLAEMLGMQCAAGAHYRDQHYVIESNQKVRIITHEVESTGNLIQGFRNARDAPKEVIDANGFAMLYGEDIVTVGTTPPEEDIKQLRSALEVGGHFSWTSACVAQDLIDVAPHGWGGQETPWAAWQPETCGLHALLVAKKREGGIWLIWFREEYLQSIAWAGDPNEGRTDSGHMCPRSSFNQFTVLRLKTSKAWTDRDLQLAKELRVLMEITQARKEIKEASALMAAIEMKDQFFANISHELRTPMYAINAMTEICLQKPYLSQEVREQLSLIHESGTSLLGLLNDLIDVRRLEAGMMSLQKAPCNITNLVTFCLQMFSRQMILKRLEWKCIANSAVKDQHFLLDKGRMQQVLVNLISNALKFTDKGQITVTIEWDPGSTLDITVEDTGIGIKQDHIGLLFHKFSQVDNSNTRIFHGAGLGLSIVKNLVELMQGNIEVTSVFGQGSKFIISLDVETSIPQGVETEVQPGPPQAPSYGYLGCSLPDAPDAPEEQRDVDTADENGGSCFGGVLSIFKKKKRRTTQDRNNSAAKIIQKGGSPPELDENRELVLVADDNLISQTVTRKLLEEEYQTEVAGNGHEVLEHLQKGRTFYCILMDVQMPFMDGVETTRIIQQNPEWQSIPVIGLTACCFVDNVEKCKAAGMIFVLTKPTTKKNLLRALKDISHPRTPSGLNLAEIRLPDGPGNTGSSDKPQASKESENKESKDSKDAKEKKDEK